MFGAFMTIFDITFSQAGVTTNIFLPPCVGFFLAYFGAMGGVTGAFLLLPFQMSVLGYTSPGVSATNFLYNLYAIPFTVYRFSKEGRVNWPLAILIAAGSLPGISLGYYLRITILRDPHRFRPFVGLVLLYLGWRLFRGLYSSSTIHEAKRVIDRGGAIEYKATGIANFVFTLGGTTYSFRPIPLFMVALAVGLIGGAYGIGGGAILSPFCISVLDLPVYAVAGASLFGTFVSSLVGVTVYAMGIGAHGIRTAPDFLLGTLFGMGGLVGGYLGAMTQRYVAERPIKIGLLVVVLGASIKYLFF